MKFVIHMPKVIIDVRAFNLREFQQLSEERISNLRMNMEVLLDAAAAPDGSPLDALSPDYAAYKASTGRAAIRNLNFTGEMRRSMHTRAATDIDAGSELFFEGQHAVKRSQNPRPGTKEPASISNAQLAAINHAIDPWFFVSPQQLTLFEVESMAWVDESLKSLVNIKGDMQR